MEINSVGGTRPLMNQTTSIKSTSDLKTVGNINDSVSISPEAKLAGSLINFMDGAGTDGVITIDEMRSFRDKKIDAVQDILNETLNRLKIKPTDRLRIEVDPMNHVIVSGDSEENNQALAQALQEHDQFVNTYNAASGTSSFIAAAEAAVPFHEAYSADPKAAVAQYAWLFDKDWDFSLFFAEGKASYSVT